jgi:hypothetical protein
MTFIRCLLKSYGSPQNLLGVKFRMILWNIIHDQAAMMGNTFRNLLPFMPASLIHLKTNRNSFTMIKDTCEHCNESVRIIFFLAQHPKYKRLLPFFYPNPSRLWTKTGSCFIRKKCDSFCLTSVDRQEFFLLSFETPPSPPWSLEQTDKSVAAKKNLTAESTAGLGAPSIEHHNSSPDTRPPQPRPTGFASNQMPWGLSLRPPAKSSQFAWQSSKDDQAVSFHPLLKPLSHLLFGSISLWFSGPGRRVWQFGVNSILPKGEGWRRYVSRPRLRASFLPFLKRLYELRTCWLRIMVSWHSSRKKILNAFRKVLYIKP